MEVNKDGFEHVLGTNEIKCANGITLEKDCMSFCPKITFSYE
jgi:hypothetical protein